MVLKNLNYRIGLYIYMDILPIHNEPALLIEELDTLIIADLHIGMEHEIFKAGANMPSGTRDMKRHIIRLIKENNVKKLILAGDVKHQVPGHSHQEYRELPFFFQDILEHVDSIDITKGNHDGNIEDFISPGVRVHPSSGMVMGNRDVGIWHGHAWPSPEIIASKISVMAHNHPAMVFVDGLDIHGKVKCWLRGPWDIERCAERYDDIGGGYIMMPAFNPLCGGTYVNEASARMRGTVMRNGFADLGNSTIYHLDGTFMGLVKDNRVEVERGYFDRGRRTDHSK